MGMPQAQPYGMGMGMPFTQPTQPVNQVNDLLGAFGTTPSVPQTSGINTFGGFNAAPADTANTLTLEAVKDNNLEVVFHCKKV